MRKRIAALLLSLVMLFSLSGCRPAAELAELVEGIYAPYSVSRDIPSFSNIEYTRPDVSQIQRSAETIVKLLRGFLNNFRLMSELDRFFELYYSFNTMQTLADIRSDLDTSDAFYREESNYCSSVDPTVSELYDQVVFSCAYSRHAKFLDLTYFDGLLSELQAREDQVRDREKLTEQYTQQNELLNRYNELIIEMRARNDDDAYADYNAEIGEIYIELVKLRREIAENRGYDSYEDMCLDEYKMGYTAEELHTFAEDIKTNIVPLFKEAYDQRLFSEYYETTDMNAADALAKVKTVCSELGGDPLEALRFMLDNRLYDVNPSASKYDISYVMYLEDYEAPYLLVNPDGCGEDVLTIAHEFGHFLDNYVNYGDDISLDSSEMFSQGMEYMVLSRLADAQLQEELSKYKMLDLLYLYTNQPCFFEFEEQVYALSDEELTVERVNSIFAETAAAYAFGENYSKSEKDTIWIDIVHFFIQPFYVISYCISDSAALALYNMELQSPGSGFAKYSVLVNSCAELEFVELMKEKGMESPITEAAVQRIAQTIKTGLGM